MTKTEQEDQSHLWHLWGNTYDLSKFMDKHPGGKAILQITKGNQDVTAMFESYHAFANIEEIRTEIETYKVGKSNQKVLNTFEKDGFYCVVRDRVRAHFGSEKVLTKKIKYDTFWLSKIILIVSFLFTNLYFAFFDQNISTLRACLHSTLTAMSVMSLGFCIFHDATHFALFSGKNSYKNDILARIIGAMMLWSTEMWMVHHAFRHHTYTGNAQLDPDMLNYLPFIRKTARTLKNKVFNIPLKVLPYVATFVLWVFPGQFIGQIVAYWFMWRRRQHLWKMSYPKEIIDRKVWENGIFFFFIFMHFYKLNFWVSFTYTLTVNICYALAIIPDHDTNETALNHDDTKKDWGEMQVRNSGNFFNKKFFESYSHIFGGINYQIEHHLFPSMCGTHLPKIAPIVKEACKEFNVPYVHHSTVMGAYSDFLELIKRVRQMA